MKTIDYLERSRLYRKLIHGPHSEFARIFAGRLLDDQLSRQCTIRSLSLFRDLMDWQIGRGNRAADLNEQHVAQFFDDRRAGSVYLNSLRAVSKWISALVMPQPGLAAAH